MSQLVLCRTCGKRIYDLNGSYLFGADGIEILEKVHTLTGIQLNEEQHMPRHICGSCQMDLNLSIAFRSRCIKVHKFLLNRKLKKLQLNRAKIEEVQPQIQIVSVKSQNQLSDQKLKQTIKAQQMLKKPSSIISIHCKTPSINPRKERFESFQETPQEKVEKKSISRVTICEKTPSIKQENIKCSPDYKPSGSNKNSPQESSSKTSIRKVSICEESQPNHNRKRIFEPIHKLKSRRKYVQNVVMSEDSDNDIRDEFGKKPRKTLPKNLVCEQCGKCFADSSNLKLHVLRHTGVKDFKCTECGSEFLTRHLMHLHIRVRHLGEKPYACKFCEQRFFTSTSRCRHERIHHIRKLSYMCRFCGKGFLTRVCLKKHEFLHTGERPFSCDICNVAFPRNSTLKIHNRSKTHQKKAATLVKSEVSSLANTVVQSDPLEMTEDFSEEDELIFAESIIEEIDIT